MIPVASPRRALAPVASLDARDSRDEGRRLRADMRLGEFEFATSLEGRRSGQEFVEDNGEGIDIAAFVTFQTAALFWRHIEQRADRGSGARHALASAHPRDPKIH